MGRWRVLAKAGGRGAEGEGEGSDDEGTGVRPRGSFLLSGVAGCGCGGLPAGEGEDGAPAWAWRSESCCTGEAVVAVEGETARDGGRPLLLGTRSGGFPGMFSAEGRRHRRGESSTVNEAMSDTSGCTRGFCTVMARRRAAEDVVWNRRQGAEREREHETGRWRCREKMRRLGYQPIHTTGSCSRRGAVCGCCSFLRILGVFLDKRAIFTPCDC